MQDSSTWRRVAISTPLVRPRPCAVPTAHPLAIACTSKRAVDARRAVSAVRRPVSICMAPMCFSWFVSNSRLTS
eukprot:9467305-Pyramimonas_sp.AAC.2